MGSARGNAQQSLHAFARLGVFGAMAPGLFGFGVSLAFEREQGLLMFKQALPMPPGSYLLARMVMAMIFVALIGSLLMIALALFVAHVPLTLGQCVERVLSSTCSACCRSARMGLLVGSLVSGQAAPAIVNLIYLPMAFLSGLWVPLQFLPQGRSRTSRRCGPRITCRSCRCDAMGLPSVGFDRDPRRRAGRRDRAVLHARRAPARRTRHPAARRPARRLRHSRCAARSTCGMFWIAVGLVIAGVMGGNAPHAAARTAATSNDAAEPVPDASGSAAPVGVAAPDEAADRGLRRWRCQRQLRPGLRARPTTRCAAAIPASRRRWSTAEPGTRRARSKSSGEVGNGHPVSLRRHVVPAERHPKAEWTKQGLMDYSGKQDPALLRARRRPDYTGDARWARRWTRFPPCTASPPARSGRKCACLCRTSAASISSGSSCIIIGTMTPGAIPLPDRRRARGMRQS